MIQRWTFLDVDTTELWRLPRNPRAMASIDSKRRSTASLRADGVVLVHREGVLAFPWEFTGRIHSQAEYETFEDWKTRREVVVTDHLGREHVVIPTAFEPVPFKQNGTGNPWLFNYTFKALYLRRQT